MQEGYAQLEAKEEEAKVVNDIASDIIDQNPEGVTVDLRERMENLTKQMQAVRLKADKVKVWSNTLIIFHYQIKYR